MTNSKMIELDNPEKIKAKFKEQVQLAFIKNLNSLWQASPATLFDFKFMNIFEPIMNSLKKGLNQQQSSEDLNSLIDDLNFELIKQSNHHDQLLQAFVSKPFSLELVKYNNRIWCRVVELKTGYVFNLAFQHDNQDLLKIAYGNNPNSYGDQTKTFELYCKRIDIDLEQMKTLMNVLVGYLKNEGFEALEMVESIDCMSR